MNLPPVVTQRKWLPTSSAAAPMSFALSLTPMLVVVVAIVQFEFKFHFINLPQPPASREASAALALSLSLGALSRTRALLCMLSLIFVCLRLQPVTAFGTLPQPSALSALLCMHSLTVVRFICLRRLVRLTLTQPSGCLRSLSLPLPAPST